MKKVVEELSIYLIISSIFFVICALAVLMVDKGEMHLFLNQFHGSFFDFFFKYFTHVGDGIFAAVVLPVLLLLHRKNVWHNFILAVGTFVLVPLVVQYLKRVVFYQYPRPIRLLGEESLYLVPGVEVSHIYSFPSGHAAAIFAFFIMISYMFRANKNLQIALAFAAIIGAYSRVYLSYHFVVDILAGGILGITCFLLARTVLNRPLNRIDSKS